AHTKVGLAETLASTNHSTIPLPFVVLIGGLEAAMYHCDCASNRHFWDIGRGIRQWGKLHGWTPVTSHQFILHPRRATARGAFGASACPRAGGGGEVAGVADR
ncbi:MAG: hypothetical protein NZT92_17520, partial [Abditibacteriales bacterium]|nr:hypothetical protein [Abditibacteriales bacterium]